MKQETMKLPKGFAVLTMGAFVGTLVKDAEIEFVDQPEANPDRIAEEAAAAGRTDVREMLAHTAVRENEETRKDETVYVSYGADGSRIENKEKPAKVTPSAEHDPEAVEKAAAKVREIQAAETEAQEKSEAEAKTQAQAKKQADAKAEVKAEAEKAETDTKTDPKTQTVEGLVANNTFKQLTAMAKDAGLDGNKSTNKTELATAILNAK